MSNKDIVLRQWYQELWDKWNVSTADELFADNYRLHLPGSAAALDRDATKGVVKMFSVAFPDLQHTVDEMIAEGNTVAARWSVRGTHRGDFQGIAPTGKQIIVSGTTVHHPGEQQDCGNMAHLRYDGFAAAAWRSASARRGLGTIVVVARPA